MASNALLTHLNALNKLVGSLASPEHSKSPPDYDWQLWSQLAKNNQQFPINVDLSPHHEFNNDLPNLWIERTPIALFTGVVVGEYKRQPRPDEWAIHLADALADTCDGFSLSTRPDTFPRFRRIDPDMPWECAMHRHINPERGHFWCLSSILFKTANFVHKSSNEKTVMDLKCGAIIFHKDPGDPPANGCGHFLPGEVECALSILIYQCQMSSELGKVGWEPVQEDHQYFARIINITTKIIRVLEARIDPGNKHDLSLRIIYTIKIPSRNNDQFTDEWSQLVELALANTGNESPSEGEKVPEAVPSSTGESLVVHRRRPLSGAIGQNNCQSLSKEDEAQRRCQESSGAGRGVSGMSTDSEDLEVPQSRNFSSGVQQQNVSDSSDSDDNTTQR